MSLNLTPLDHRVIIKQRKAEDKKGGIILPEGAKKKPAIGDVVAVGLGRWLDNGTRQNIGVNVGHAVYYASYAGTEIDVDGETYVILSADDVLAVEISKKK